MQAEEIINRKFSRAFRGYDIGEVDAFLDEILRDQERMEQELALLQVRNKMLLDEISKSDPSFLPPLDCEKEPEGESKDA